MSLGPTQIAAVLHAGSSVMVSQVSGFPGLIGRFQAVLRTDIPVDLRDSRGAPNSTALRDLLSRGTREARPLLVLLGAGVPERVWAALEELTHASGVPVLALTSGSAPAERLTRWLKVTEQGMS